MADYGKILNGATKCECTVYNEADFIDVKRRVDFAPEGYLLIEKSPVKPDVPVWDLVLHYRVVGDKILKSYSVSGHPRTYSKLKMYVVFAKAGLWDRLVEWMSSVVTPDGISAKLAFDLANEITDAHPLFESFYARAKAALGVTDEQADALLDQCVADKEVANG